MKLSKEEVMVTKAIAERGTSVRRLAGQLGVTDGALRYRLKKLEEKPGRDGRDRPTVLDGYAEVVEAIQLALGDGRLTGEGRPAQVRQIYEILVRDHGYEGSYQAAVRPLRRKHGRPRLRALRWVVYRTRFSGQGRPKHQAALRRSFSRAQAGVKYSRSPCCG